MLRFLPNLCQSISLLEETRFSLTPQATSVPHLKMWSFAKLINANYIPFNVINRFGSTAAGLRRFYILLTAVSTILIIIGASFFRLSQNVVDTHKPFGASTLQTTRVRAPEDTAQGQKDFSTTKPFIYLTQTEQCLPPNMASSAQIGDPRTCNCDVIVLSYRAKCQEEKPDSHITYVFDPTTSWSSGRNELFFSAMGRQPGYHYYIFIDDDAVLRFNEFTPPEMKKLQPFRTFEEWLLDYEPALGVVNYRRHSASWNFDRRKNLCGITNRSMVIPTVWFDGVINAYHHKAVTHILPYPTIGKKESWYIPNKHIMSAAELTFRGQVMMYVPVSVRNSGHSSYPKAVAPKVMQTYWRKFIEKIRQRAPSVYKNHSIWEEFKQGLRGYMNNSTTHCMNATAHLPIAPFAHFERQTL